MPSFEEYLNQATNVLQQGGLVAIPTETVYGLAALVSIPQACARIFEVKARPHFDPLIVHILNQDWIERYASLDRKTSLQVELLTEAFWPGPLTLVLPKKTRVPDIITSGLQTVAIRSPQHPFAQALLIKLQEAFAAPSANRFGKLSPTKASHVVKSLGPNTVDLIVDLEGCKEGIESSILDLSTPTPVLRRPGSVTKEQIESILNTPVDTEQKNTGIFPGELKGHYAPDMPIELRDLKDIRAMSAIEKKSKAVLTFSEKIEGFDFQEILSPSGHLIEAASRLFECLHKLNQSNATRIIAERLPEQGLGLAMMNRLKKAEASFD